MQSNKQQPQSIIESQRFTSTTGIIDWNPKTISWFLRNEKWHKSNSQCYQKI